MLTIGGYTDKHRALSLLRASVPVEREAVNKKHMPGQ
jgi:hypothetical protein